MPLKLTDIIKSRRSIRKWSSAKIPERVMQEILECGHSAPSAFGKKPFHFVPIQEKQKIMDLMKGRYQHKEWPYGINSEKYAKQTGINNYEKPSLPGSIIAVCGDKTKYPEEASLVQTLSAAATTMLISIHSLGLGGCWLYVYDPATPETEGDVRRLLKLDDKYMILCLIAYGYIDNKIKL